MNILKLYNLISFISGIIINNIQSFDKSIFSSEILFTSSLQMTTNKTIKDIASYQLADIFSVRKFCLRSAKK